MVQYLASCGCVRIFCNILARTWILLVKTVGDAVDKDLRQASNAADTDVVAVVEAFVAVVVAVAGVTFVVVEFIMTAGGGGGGDGRVVLVALLLVVVEVLVIVVLEVLIVVACTAAAATVVSTGGTGFPMQCTTLPSSNWNAVMTFW